MVDAGDEDPRAGVRLRPFLRACVTSRQRLTVEQATLIEAARNGFVETFGSAPNGVWFAPGRINVIGEHTDYNNGLVLPYALDRGVAVAASLRNSGWVDVISEQTGSTRFAIDGIGRSRPGLGHVEGAVWAAVGAGMEIPGLRVFVTSTLPVGAGLSSSSAFICALLVAVNDLSGSGHSPDALALTAKKAETEGVGVPIGVMDPMVSMLAQEGHALLLDCQSLEYEHVALAAATVGAATDILIVDTRTERTLVGGEYAARRRVCHEAAAALGVSSLREISLSQLEARWGDLDEVRQRRARHVVTENARVLCAADRLRVGDMIGLGKLLDDSHRSLVEDFEVSAPALDLAVSVCREGGAYGARLTGAGFGGCVIGFFPPGCLPSLEIALGKSFSARELARPSVFLGKSGRSAGRADAG